MDRPIGVIDSGVGGLTVLHELQRQLPKEQFIYLGDTLRCPYGTRNHEEVRQYTWQMVRYLLRFDIKMLIVACNTATALTLDELKKELTIPVVGVIEPGARAAIKATKTNSVAIIGTNNTIQSKAYEQALKTIHHNIKTIGVACPKFVPLIEQGDILSERTKYVVEESLKFIKNDTTIDTLILGCTHYPIIQPIIEDVVGKNITVLSSAVETGLEVSALLMYHNMLATGQKFKESIILSTGDLQMFQRLQDEFLHFSHFQLKHITL